MIIHSGHQVVNEQLDNQLELDPPVTRRAKLLRQLGKLHTRPR